MELLNILLPLGITLIITFFIGFERQNIGKSAGVTAHVFIAIACCSIAILQRYLYNEAIKLAENGLSVTVENQRMIAQLLAGIGFLGAGIIMKDKNHISGLTTATTLWSSAIIGIIVGMKYYMLGVTLGVIIILFIYGRDISKGVNPFKKLIKPNNQNDDIDK